MQIEPLSNRAVAVITAFGSNTLLQILDVNLNEIARKTLPGAEMARPLWPHQIQAIISMSKD